MNNQVNSVAATRINGVAFKQFCEANGVTGVSNVRKNKSGYPYLTLLSPKFEGGAQNIYFGKRSAAVIKEDQDVKTIGLGQAIIAETKNAAKEDRLKISLSGYTDVDDLF